VATDDEFESFRGSIADLDDDRERRIRSKFEGLRGPVQPSSSSPTATPAEPVASRVVDPSLEPPANTRHTRPVLVGVAAAVVLMVLIGTITLVRSSDDGADVASGIDDLPLSELAVRAGARADVELPPNGILHGTQLQGSQTAKVRERAATLTLMTREEWARRDGTGTVRTSSDVVALGPGTPLGTPTAPHDIDVVEPGPLHGSLPYDELRALPTEPAELLAFVQTQVTADDSASAAEWLSRMLSIEVVPPATRAAGFGALGLLGAAPVGALSNYSGETSNAYDGVDENGRPWVVLIDPVTTRVTGFATLGGEGEAMFRDAERWREFGPQEIVSELPN
jgi:hypothetical protein